MLRSRASSQPRIRLLLELLEDRVLLDSAPLLSPPPTTTSGNLSAFTSGTGAGWDDDEENAPPVLILPQTTFTDVKTAPLSVLISATDRDAHESLTFSLVGAPAGAGISTQQQAVASGSAATGLLAWTPTEDQGPASYSFTVMVTDNGQPARSASKTVTVNTLAVGLVGNDLWIVGTSQGAPGNPPNVGDAVVVSATNSANTVSVTVNGATGNFTVPAGGQIRAKLYGGDDSFTVNQGTGTQLIAPAISVDGGLGTNSLTVNGTSAPDAFSITATTVSLAGAGTLSYANIQTLAVNGLGGNDTFAMTGISPATATTLDGGADTDAFAGNFAADFGGTLALANMESATLAIAGAVTGGSSITGSDFTSMNVGTVAGTVFASGGSIAGATIGTVAPTGLLKATETASLTKGLLTNSTIGVVAGTVSAASIVNTNIGAVAPGGLVIATGQGTTSNVSIGTLGGSFLAPEDSNAGSGVMTETSIDSITSSGMVSTGSISGMSVGTTDAGSSITAAGQGTTSNVSIGTLGGSFFAPEDGNAGSGVMTDTSIDSITSSGMVSTGSISGMSVGTTDAGSSITAAGQGTTSNVSIGTLGGSFFAPEDGNAGSGVMTDTSIDSITSSGMVSTGSISGMSVGTTDAGSSITAAGQGTTSNVSIGTLGGSFFAPEDSNAGSGVMTDTSIDSITSSGMVSTGSISGMSVGTTDAGSSITAAGAGTIINLSINKHGGTVTCKKDNMPGSGALTNSLVGTLTATGVINANTASNLGIAAVGGTVNVPGALTNFTVGTLLPTANLATGNLQTLTVQHASPLVKFNAPAVTRIVSLTPHVPGGGIPDYSFYYDGSGAGNPKVVLQINAAAPGNFDLAITTSVATGAGNGFDLAGLYSVGNRPTGIHNLVVGGNLLVGAVPAGAVSALGLPNATGGVQLPQDIVAVAVAGALPAASVTAKSVPSLAANSFAGVSADRACAGDAKIPLAKGTGLSQANDTFLVFASEAGHVAQFLVTCLGGWFDDEKMLFADIVSDNQPITAQDTVVAGRFGSIVTGVVFTGQGASLTTEQPITTSIVALPGGSIGDLILGAPHGITADVTADRIIGNIDATEGGISGTIKTTIGDLGRAFTDAAGNITGVTYVHAGGHLTGKILVKGNLVSQVNLDDDLNGIVATDGDIGIIQTVGGVAKLNTDGSLIRFGGIMTKDDGLGQIIALGNVFGDISVADGLQGRIAVKGKQGEYGLAPSRFGILGNVSIRNGVSTTGAIVSTGLLADDGTNNTTNDVPGTHLSISASDKGIVAAGEDINFGSTGSLNKPGLFENASGSNLNAINYIFTSGGTLLDVIDPAQLTLIVQDLLALKVVNGKLTGTTA